MRHVIQTALVFDLSQPEYLLIEYGEDGGGRCIGEYFTLEDAFKGAHSRIGHKLDAVSEKRIALVRW
jgi:hypothetical protein